MAMKVTKVLFFIVVTMAITFSYRHHGYRRTRNLVKRQATPCDSNSVYRTFDGSCNNLDHPEWGSVGEPFRRLAPNDYEDRISVPRSLSESGGPLPSPRNVSLTYHGPSTNRECVTLMVMQWGQFLDHDLTLAPFAVDDTDIDCCNSPLPECFPIPLDSNDEFFGGSGRSCLSFVRSFRENRTSTNGTRVEEQVNELTSYIDASQVYGNSLSESVDLRGDNGLLLQVNRDGDILLPESLVNTCRNDTGEYCFMAGDERVNEQPALAAMHTIWLREHNRIATSLNILNPHWSDEIIFQETRKIVGAMFQVITYNEFLPIFLGPKTLTEFGLDTIYEYQNTLDASIFNSFATAAFRSGHSLIPEALTISNEVMMFKHLFRDPTTVFDSLDELAQALSDERSMSMDRMFSRSVTRHLFEEPQQPKSGFDLVSLNLQRGRDHGLPSFNEYRERCGLPRYTSLDQLFPDVDIADGVYDDINDVDLFTGGIAETSVAGGLVGPTFACIIATQFRNLRSGDRFFYENTLGPQAFTPAQLEELQKATLAKVICTNTEDKLIQENVFLPADDGCNPLTACGAIDGIQLSAWIE